MKGAIIYFSGTGNTEFAAKQFKKQFEDKGIACSIFDISKKRSIVDNYDFFVFGCPIYDGVFSEYFLDWIEKNINNGKERRCIAFSTSAGDTGTAVFDLSNILLSKSFDVLIKDNVIMPNNYYIVTANKTSDTEKNRIKEIAAKKIERMVNAFINEERNEIEIPEGKLVIDREKNKNYKVLWDYWGAKNLKADMDVCVRCGKCVKNCPTHNIRLAETITFKDKCLACQKCVHSCPVNAFLYNDHKVEQYKL